MGLNLILYCLLGDYKETFGTNVPFKDFGFNSLEEFLKNDNDNFHVIGTRVQAVAKPASLHISSLVSKQKNSKKSGRSKLVSLFFIKKRKNSQYVI